MVAPRRLMTPAPSLARSAAVMVGCPARRPSTAAVTGRDGLATSALVTSPS